jgi:hypothetical protein
MYLAWKKRKVQTSRPSDGCLHQGQAGRVALVPTLVRSRRVSGKPRQEHVAALPSIRTCCLGDPLVRARWWREAEEILEKLQQSAEVTDASKGRGQDWLRRVRAGLETRVTYPTPEEWAAFNAQAAERLRRERFAAESREAAEQARRAEQQQQELRQKAEEEARLRQIERLQALEERVQKGTEDCVEGLDLFCELVQVLEVQLAEAQRKRERRRGAPRRTVKQESAPPGQEKEDERQVERPREARRPRKVRI